MLDLKDGYKNLQGPEIDKVKESRKWFDDWCDRNQPTQNYPRQGPDSEKYRRNTDKIVFEGIAYTKKLYVYKVLKMHYLIKSSSSNSLSEKRRSIGFVAAIDEGAISILSVVSEINAVQ